MDYRNTGAVAAALWFQGWTTSIVDHTKTVHVPHVADYEPGAFFRRELPCLTAVLALGPRPDVIVIDGYVHLSENVPGLGMHLHQLFGGFIVGVAKTKFAGNSVAVPVTRGRSRSPIYVTSVGLSVQEAAKAIQSMHGDFRVPTLLKQVDRVARTASLEVAKY